MAERTPNKPKSPPAQTAKVAPARAIASNKAAAKVTAAKPAGKLPPVRAAAAKKSNASQAAGSLQSAMERLEGRMADLQRERDSLQRERDSLAQELTAAKLQIAAYETARDQTINRIDWVLESLQSLTEDKS